MLELGLTGILAAGLFAWLADEERNAPASAPTRHHPEKLFPTPALWVFFLSACFCFSLRDFAEQRNVHLGFLVSSERARVQSQIRRHGAFGIFFASVISNPVFGHLSDRGRVRWIGFVLLMAAGMVSVFPRVPVVWMTPVLLAYGFFVMASYPMTEAALMEAVHDPVRGRVYGVYITVGGLVGNLSPWLVGDWVEKLGPKAASPGSYLPLYTVLSLSLLASLAGLPFLHAIRKREHVETGKTAASAAGFTARQICHEPAQLFPGRFAAGSDADRRDGRAKPARR